MAHPEYAFEACRSEVEERRVLGLGWCEVDWDTAISRSALSSRKKGGEDSKVCNQASLVCGLEHGGKVE